MRKIPASGINLFQLIYRLISEYESDGSRKALNLSLGNPDLVAPDEVRALKKKFADSSLYDLSTYAEDRNLNQFAEGMVEAFSGVKLSEHPELRAIPTAGIKTASALLPLACGLHLKGRENFSVVTHLPAYDIMGTWAEGYFGAKRIVWPLESKHQMRLNLDSLKQALASAKCEKPDLIFVIRPGNPASVGATTEEWLELIQFCSERGIRLANDGAYATLGEASSHTPLSTVAASISEKYPNFEWVELFSMSKALSDPGQRLGVIVGTKDFIEDWNLMKGNTDSGPAPLGMFTYGELFKDRVLTQRLLKETRDIYRDRLNFIVPTLKKAGFTPACETSAGFFTLWRTPKHAFGEDLEAEAVKEGRPLAEVFNRKVITRTGLVGVHFSSPTGEAFIRYAACFDILKPENQNRLVEAMNEIKPRY
jgi:aspartate/methionine/tyrosine aminotransferase